MPDFQALAQLCEMKIGTSVSTQLIPYIKKLKEVNQNALNKIVELQAEIAELKQQQQPPTVQEALTERIAQALLQCDSRVESNGGGVNGYALVHIPFAVEKLAAIIQPTTVQGWEAKFRTDFREVLKQDDEAVDITEWFIRWVKENVLVSRTPGIRSSDIPALTKGQAHSPSDNHSC
jgi:hypothetical protein